MKKHIQCLKHQTHKLNFRPQTEGSAHSLHCWDQDKEGKEEYGAATCQVQDMVQDTLLLLHCLILTNALLEGITVIFTS